MNRPAESLGAFPAAWRARSWMFAATGTFDVVVVGGGITGAGVARDAALRGLRTALLEQYDFASGTSSRSSRLVHGGVRYLEHGHLHLVLESSRERRRLLRIAPHLVRPLAFTWPVYAGARVGGWKLRAGLRLYDALALFRNVAPSRRLAPDAVREAEPALRSEALRGGARYYDAAADDARLVLANVVAAREQGALALNYARVELVEPGEGAWTLTVRDQASGEGMRLRARCVVMALGPWSGDVSALTGGEAEQPRVTPSLGAHIALPRRLVRNSGALTLLAPADGRVFFVLPERELSIVTTTETPWRQRVEDARASRADVQYLLEGVNHYFPAAAATDADVVAAWAGVRPLAASGDDGDLASASREHSIAETGPRLYVVTGGKLTTYRAMAEEVVDRIAAALRINGMDCVTHRVPLPGGEVQNVPRAITAVLKNVGDPDVAERLVRAHGARWTRVLEGDRSMRRVVPGLPYLEQEVDYAIERELALTLGDVLLRRVPLAFRLSDHGAAASVRIVERLARRWNWTPGERDAALRACARETERTFARETA